MHRPTPARSRLTRSLLASPCAACRPLRAAQALPVPNGSPSKKDAKAAAADDKARGLLQRWAGLHSARTALAGFAFGSALCGVLLLNKKN